MMRTARWGTLIVTTLQYASCFRFLVHVAVLIHSNFVVSESRVSHHHNTLPAIVMDDAPKEQFLDLSDIASDSHHQMHWLPCTIQHNGPAPVDTYFVVQGAADIINKKRTHDSPNRQPCRTPRSGAARRTPAPATLHPRPHPATYANRLASHWQLFRDDVLEPRATTGAHRRRAASARVDDACPRGA